MTFDTYQLLICFILTLFQQFLNFQVTTHVTHFKTIKISPGIQLLPNSPFSKLPTKCIFNVCHLQINEPNDFNQKYKHFCLQQFYLRKPQLFRLEKEKNTAQVKPYEHAIVNFWPRTSLLLILLMLVVLTIIEPKCHCNQCLPPCFLQEVMQFGRKTIWSGNPYLLITGQYEKTM